MGVRAVFICDNSQPIPEAAMGWEQFDGKDQPGSDVFRVQVKQGDAMGGQAIEGFKAMAKYQGCSGFCVCKDGYVNFKNLTSTQRHCLKDTSAVRAVFICDA